MYSYVLYVHMYPAMSKLVIISVLIISALSNAVVQSKESVSSYGKNEEISPRIVNGTAVRQGEYPWSMAVFHENDFACMAALITPKTALTVSHCFFSTLKAGDKTFVFRYDFGEFHGKIGDIRLRHAESVHFRRVILHENFDYINQLNDIALLILKERVELSERINIIALPRRYMVFSGTADVAGWGSCSNGTNMALENLHVVKMNLMNLARCANLFELPLQKEIYLCAWAEKKGPCRGDSGASLIWSGGGTKRSIGVLLGGEIKNAIGMTAGFSSTVYYTEWLIRNVEGEITFTY